jgi:hypothetical protein
MGRRPVTLVMHLMTKPGADKRPELAIGLGRLSCPEDEDCSLHVTESSERAGIAVILRRQKLTDTEHPWIARDHDPEGKAYRYHATFETESATEIVNSVKRMLEMTGITLLDK